MENDPELEFEFYLADRLGMTVHKLRSTMSNDEFVHWAIYYGRKAQRQELATKMARNGR
jgi:hypothetical protein